MVGFLSNDNPKNDRHILTAVYVKMFGLNALSMDCT